MINVFYKLSTNVRLEKLEEGAIILIKEQKKTICLGEFECEIMQIILDNSYEKALEIILSKYMGIGIKEDMDEFCNKLCKAGVLQRYE